MRQKILFRNFVKNMKGKKINMNINKISLISFQKREVAKCGVINNGQRQECTIFELDKPESNDKDYFEILEASGEWDDIRDELAMQNQSYKLGSKRKLPVGTSTDTYVIEDNHERCLGYMLTVDESNGRMEINQLASNPTGKKEGIKYIGETLITFLAKKALKTKEIARLTVSSWYESAENFYKKCLFRQIKGKTDTKTKTMLEALGCPYSNNILALERSLFKTLIKQNKEDHKCGEIIDIEN